MPVASTTFRAMTCEKFENDDELLRADYSIECKSARHRKHEVLAVASTLIIVIAQPLALLLCLVMGKRAKDNETGSALVTVFDVLSEVRTR